MKKVAWLTLSISIALILAGCGRGRIPNTVYSPGDVAGRTIGVLSGTSSVRSAAGFGVVKMYNDTESLLDALKSGAVDCVVMEDLRAQSVVAKASGVKLLSEPVLEYDLHFAVAKENAKLTKEVNSALAVLTENGTLEALCGRYILGVRFDYVPPANIAPNPGVLSIAVPGTLSPYSYKNAEGELAGLDIDIARAVCDILGVELLVVETDEEELVNSVRLGKADFALGEITGSDADGELVDFSDAYFHSVQAVIVRK